MNDSAVLLVRDLHIIVAFWVAAIGAVTLGAITALNSTESKPAWPFRIFLIFFLNSGLSRRTRLKNHVKSRARFSFREQLLGSIIGWFLILFAAGLIVGAIWR